MQSWKYSSSAHRLIHWFCSPCSWKHRGLAVISSADSLPWISDYWKTWQHWLSIFLSAVTSHFPHASLSPSLPFHSLPYPPSSSSLSLISLLSPQHFSLSPQTWTVQCQPLFHWQTEMEIALCPPPSSGGGQCHKKVDVASSHSISAGEASEDTLTQTNLRLSGKPQSLREI